MVVNVMNIKLQCIFYVFVPIINSQKVPAMWNLEYLKSVMVLLFAELAIMNVTDHLRDQAQICWMQSHAC